VSSPPIMMLRDSGPMTQLPCWVVADRSDSSTGHAGIWNHAHSPRRGPMQPNLFPLNGLHSSHKDRADYSKSKPEFQYRFARFPRYSPGRQEACVEGTTLYAVRVMFCHKVRYCLGKGPLAIGYSLLARWTGGAGVVSDFGLVVAFFLAPMGRKVGLRRIFGFSRFGAPAGRPFAHNDDPMPFSEEPGTSAARNFWSTVCPFWGILRFAPNDK
jgi:hypothetical protein